MKKKILKLRQIRREQNLSLQKLADLLGVSINTLRSWELQLHIPKESRARELAEILNTTVEEITTPIDFSYDGFAFKFPIRRMYFIRKSKNLTLYEVSQATEISPQRISMIEKGKSNLYFDTLISLCNFYQDYDANELMEMVHSYDEL